MEFAGRTPPLLFLLPFALCLLRLVPCQSLSPVALSRIHSAFVGAPTKESVRRPDPRSGERPATTNTKARGRFAALRPLHSASTSVVENETSSAAADNEPPSNASTNAVVNETTGYRSLYPPIAPNRNGTLQVDSLHTIYYEEYGRDPTAELDTVDKDYEGQEHLPPIKTALFLHGGPGAGCFPNHARFFDPSVYRVVLFDQRGCGRSSPRGETRNNTLGYLVRDCEALRDELGVDRWDVVLGGSWGTTLALAYARDFPGSVASLVLRAVCLLRPAEVDWLFGSRGGAAASNPGGWREFEGAVGVGRISDDGVSASGSDDVGERVALHAYYDMLLGEDPLVRLHAARAWFKWEMAVTASAGSSANEDGRNGSLLEEPSACLVFKRSSGWIFCGKELSAIPESGSERSAVEIALSLRRSLPPASPPPVSNSERELRVPGRTEAAPESFNLTQMNVTADEAGQFVPAQAMLTCFYSTNDKYIMQNYDILSEENMDRIRHIPCIAVQGGRDPICPPDTALDLHSVWPEMELRVPLAAGHSMYDPAVTSELVAAIERMAAREFE